MPYQHLTSDARSQIYALKSNGYTQKQIAKHLGVSASTICREVARNTGGRGYRPKQAHELSVQRRYLASSEPKKLIPEMVRRIKEYLVEGLSPEQISGRMKLFGNTISQETIYQYIWVNKRNGGDLHKLLRRKGKKYNYHGSSMAGRGCIPNRVDISNRPAIVEKKTRFGDWEADTIIGAKHKGAILSLVERKSKYTLIVNLVAKTAEEVFRGIKIAFNRLPRKIAKTMTYDNGKEFSCHGMIAELLNIKCYFARPYRSCDRGLNEHTNGLIREYYPKGTDFSNLSDKETQWIEDRLNNRPRKVLGFLTPREVLLGFNQPQVIALHG